MSTEEWRDIAGYEGRYEVSDLGRVRSIDRMTVLADGRLRHVGERILKQSIASNGYLTVSLHLRGQITYTVHSIVAKAFLGEPSASQEVCHVDGNPLNPALSNLRWDTHSANNLDQITHGTHPQAFKTHCPKGHEYTPENTRIYHNRRNCRTCHRAAVKRHDAIRRAA